MLLWVSDDGLGLHGSSGHLVCCRKRGEADPHKLLEEPVVAEVAGKHRRSAAQVLLRYHVQRGIPVIPKSDKPHHILENSKIFDFSLSEEDMAALAGLDRGWKACALDEIKSHPYYPFD